MSRKNIGTTAVNNDGSTTINFHASPTDMGKWFEQHQGFRQQGSLGEKAFLRKGRLHSEKIDPKLKSPSLNIVIHIVGSRGDVQPFIPIAQLLQRPPHNHRVRIATHATFKKLVEDNGIEFFNIGGDPEALMSYMVRNPGLLPGMESLKAGDIGKRRREMAEIIDGVWRSCIEAGDGMGPRKTAVEVEATSDLFLADLIISNPPAMTHIHCAETLGIPLHMVFTMPWSPTEAFHHPLVSMNYNKEDKKQANYLSFAMMELLTWQGLGDLINDTRAKQLRLDPVSPLWGHQLLSRLHVPYTYLWSQSLISKPTDWGNHIEIAGFSFLPLGKTYTPDADLLRFLESGEAPIYIGFGSIVIDDPAALTRLIREATKKAGVRAIVSKGWGGIGGTDDTPDNIFLIDNVPHDWLFQYVAAVVHHGGAGTTAAGIAAGLPTVVVPFFGDQPFWGSMVARAGAGPVPVPFKDMTSDTLAESIRFAMKAEVREAAQEMAGKIALEDGAATATEHISETLGLDNMRCDLCPDRLATYRHRTMDLHLSTFAMITLAQSRVCRGEDFKLLRHREWYVDEGPAHYVVGTIAAATGFVHNVGSAFRNYSRRRTRVGAQQQARKDAGEKGSKPQNGAVQYATVNAEGEVDPINENWTPQQLQALVKKLASRSPTTRDFNSGPLEEKSCTEKSAIAGHLHALGQFGVDLGAAGLKAPVALLYNVANGFHNWPSYASSSIVVRRREPITGFKSGCHAAGKGFVYGFADAGHGLVMMPYEGAKRDGVKGFGKGAFFGFGVFINNIAAGLVGLPGYTLKGIERDISKRRMSQLTAEMMLIRARRGIEEYKVASQAERDEVIAKFKKLRV